MNTKTLEEADTQVLGVSMDSAFANNAFARINFLIGKDGKIMEMQVDDEAIDPTKLVTACERKKHAK